MTKGRVLRVYNLKRVVEQLPALSWPGIVSQMQVMRATGTDGNLGAPSGAREGGKQCIMVDAGGQCNHANDTENAVLNGPSWIRTSDQWIMSPLL